MDLKEDVDACGLTDKEKELADRMEIAGRELVAANELLNGKSYEQIAEKLGMTLVAVRKMFVRPGMRLYLKERQKIWEDETSAARCTIQQAINNGFMEAIEAAIIGTIKNPEAAARDRIRATEVLGKYQNLVAPATKQADKGAKQAVNVTFGVREMENMKTALREVGRSELASAIEERQKGLVQ